MGESLDPVGESLYPVGESLYPMGESLYPMGESLYPVGESLYPMGESLYPVGESLYPVGESLYPVGESLYPVGESLYPVGESKPACAVALASVPRASLLVRASTGVAESAHTATPSTRPSLPGMDFRFWNSLRSLDTVNQEKSHEGYDHGGGARPRCRRRRERR